MEPPSPSFADEFNVPQEVIVLVFDVHRAAVSLPFQVHPLEVLVEAGLVIFSSVWLLDPVCVVACVLQLSSSLIQVCLIISVPTPLSFSFLSRYRLLLLQMPNVRVLVLVVGKVGRRVIVTWSFTCIVKTRYSSYLE